MSTSPLKVCTTCRKDVSNSKRIKDSKGRYFCEPCAQKFSAPKPVAKPALVDPEDDLDIAPIADHATSTTSDELDLAPEPEPAPRVARFKSSGTFPQPVPAAPIPMDGPLCPSCEKQLQRNAQICTDCGIKIPSGRPLVISFDRDEESFYYNSENAIRAIAWLIPFGLYPIASNAFATRKPIVTWIYAAITVIASLYFAIQINRLDDTSKLEQYMLWPTTQQKVTDQELLNVYLKHKNTPEGIAVLVAARAEDNDPTHTDEQRVVNYLRKIADTMTAGEFRWFQLVTNTFLHDPGSIWGFILHLGGNMLFLFIFGTRVNALIGNLKMAILYPVLGVLASLGHLWFGDSSGPALGASGAIMGLAGMYLIYFPIQRVYMAFWLKIHWRIPSLVKIWPVRGFWVLGFYISFDVVATILRSQDNVAHWAHLGGFIAGAAIAIAMLVLRLRNLGNSDLLSVVLGKYAWPIIGKPQRAIHSYKTQAF